MSDIVDIIRQQGEIQEKATKTIDVLGTVIVVGATILGVSLLIKGLKGKEIKQ